MSTKRLWSRKESFDLDREIRASRREKTKFTMDPDLAAACKAIMKYKLKRPPRIQPTIRDTRDSERYTAARG